jgi:polysaccharide export outer membrane protein
MNIRVLTPLAIAVLLCSPAFAQVPASRPGAAPAPALGDGARRSAPVAADYRLVTGDKLRIEIYKDAQLSQSLQIRPDGKITLPLVGDLAAAGRTSLELRDSIASALQEYITNPVVTVIVVETVPQTIHVMGEVRAPGAQTLVGPLSILQALSAAGGFTDFANQKDIKILRKSSSGINTTLKFNYKDAVNGSAQPLMLQAGDVIVVR